MYLNYLGTKFHNHAMSATLQEFLKELPPFLHTENLFGYQGTSFGVNRIFWHDIREEFIPGSTKTDRVCLFA